MTLALEPGAKVADRFQVMRVEEAHEDAVRATVHDLELDRDGRAWLLTASDVDERADGVLRLIGALSHPCLSPLHHAGRVEAGRVDAGGVDADATRGVLVVRRLHRGPTLAARLAGGPLAADEGVDVLEQVAHAVDAVHRTGQSLGDVGPHGIALDPVDGGAYLLDPMIAGLRHAGPSGPGTAHVEQDLTALVALVIQMLGGIDVPSQDRTPHRLPRLADRYPQYTRLDPVLAEAVRPDDRALRQGAELARAVRDALVGVLRY